MPGASVPAPVRLVAPDRKAPFVPGREAELAKVEGDGLAALGILGGDHVVLIRREQAEHGDIAAVLDDHGCATLWKVYPEGDVWRLVTGRPGQERRMSPPPRVQGVVVAVLRRS